MKDTEMKVVAHDAIAVEVDGEVPHEEVQAFDEPGFSVTVVPARDGVEAAKKCALHTPRDKVVEERDFGVDEVFAWCRHAAEFEAAAIIR